MGSRSQKLIGLSWRFASALSQHAREDSPRSVLGLWAATTSISRRAGSQLGSCRLFSTLPPHTLMAMPALSPTMTQGNISKWHKKEGDHLAPGQVLTEVETDKATMDWEGQEDGFLAKILVPSGSKDVPIGSPVAVLVEDESFVAAFKDYVAGAAAPAAPAAAPAPSPPPPAAAAAAPAKPKSNFPPHNVMGMPALSPTMNAGNIVEWKKKVGDSVAPGDMLCEVETDKATIAWEAQEEGFIAQILSPGGSKDIALGTPVAILVDEKDAVAAFANFTLADALGGSAAAPQAAPAASTPAAAPAPAAQQAPAAPKPAAAPARAPAPAAGAGGRVNASPYAKKLAADASISLAGVAGSGPGGRIIAEDVQKAIASGSAASAAAPAAGAAAAAAAPADGLFTDIPNTQIRRVVARRLLESKQTVPHYYLSMECKVDSLLQLREKLNEQASASGIKVSVNDMIIKASALALKKVPTVNSSWTADYIRQFHYVDISVAVQTPLGLMVPIVRDADKKGLAGISADVRALAAKAKAGKLMPDEFTGGTFSISNLGMFGVKQFAAIVNPPQAAILAVGGTDKKVVATSAGYAEITTMIVTLSCDHRVVDGAAGAEWLQAFKSYVENPYTMLL